MLSNALEQQGEKIPGKRVSPRAFTASLPATSNDPASCNGAADCVAVMGRSAGVDFLFAVQMVKIGANVIFDVTLVRVADGASVATGTKPVPFKKPVKALADLAKEFGTKAIAMRAAALSKPAEPTPQVKPSPPPPPPPPPPQVAVAEPTPVNAAGFGRQGLASNPNRAVRRDRPRRCRGRRGRSRRLLRLLGDEPGEQPARLAGPDLRDGAAAGDRHLAQCGHPSRRRGRARSGRGDRLHHLRPRAQIHRHLRRRRVGLKLDALVVDHEAIGQRGERAASTAKEISLL
jgi:hypothetical protein